MTKTQTIPDLRFAGFTGEWQEKKLGEVAEFSKGSGYSKGDLVASGTPVILYGRLYTNYETTIKKVDTFVIEKDNSVFSSGGEVIIPASGETSKDIARASAVEHAGILLGGDLNILKPKEDINSSFLAISISNGSAQKALAKKAQGKSVVHVRNADIAQLSILFPEKREQEAIGNFFAKLDRLISLQEDKLATLKSQKKTYLSQLFPKKGDRQPQLRFAGFTGEWEEKKLGEVGKVEMNRRIFKEETSEEGEIPFYKIGTFGGQADSFISRDLFESYKSKYSYPQKGDLLLSASGSIGRVVEYTGEEAYYQDSNIVWLNHGGRLDNRFLKQFYEIVKWSGLEGTTIKRLYNKNILETLISLPSLPEQEAIGNFFAKLDRQLELEEAKLAQLKESKKTFLKALLV